MSQEQAGGEGRLNQLSTKRVTTGPGDFDTGGKQKGKRSVLAKAHLGENKKGSSRGGVSWNRQSSVAD